MAWPVHNFIGGALPLPCFVSYIMSTPWWTGALSLWMIFAGSSANHLQDHSQVPSFCFWSAFGCPLSWKKTAIGLSNTWLGFIMTPDLQLVRMAPNKHELVIAVLDKMIDNQTFTKQELDSALWVGCSGPLTAAHSQSHSFKPFGNGNQL